MIFAKAVTNKLHGLDCDVAKLAHFGETLTAVFNCILPAQSRTFFSNNVLAQVINELKYAKFFQVKIVLVAVLPSLPLQYCSSFGSVDSPSFHRVRLVLARILVHILPMLAH